MARKRKQIVTVSREIRTVKRTKTIEIESTQPTTPKQPAAPAEIDVPIYKSSVDAVDKVLRMIKLKEEHWLSLQKTPFYIMIRSMTQRSASDFKLRKSDNTSLALIGKFDQSRKAFKLGGKFLDITVHDVMLIFGVGGGSKDIVVDRNYDRSSSNFVARRFRGLKNITRTMIKETIKTVANGDRQVDHDDLARLLTLYLCVSLFFANLGDVISWSYIKYVEDIDDINKYAWGKAIRDNLIDSITKKKDDTGKVVGCVALLNYWFYEHTCNTGLEPIRRDAFPRFLKWKLPNKGKNFREKVIDRLKRNQVIVGELEPTPFEVEQLGLNQSQMKQMEETYSEYTESEEHNYEMIVEKGNSDKESLGSEQKSAECGEANPLTRLAVVCLASDESMEDMTPEQPQKRNEADDSGLKRIMVEIEDMRQLMTSNAKREATMMKEIDELKRRTTKMEQIIVDNKSKMIAFEVQIEELNAVLQEDRVSKKAIGQQDERKSSDTDGNVHMTHTLNVLTEKEETIADLQTTVKFLDGENKRLALELRGIEEDKQPLP